jgi:hypothetical protein
LWTMCPGWLWTAILLFSASCVARIIGMSHWCPAFLFPVVRSAQVASWLLTWPTNSLKTGEVWHLCFHFLICLCSKPFPLQSLFSYHGFQKGQYLYDNELEPPGASILPVRTIILRILSMVYISHGLSEILFALVSRPLTCQSLTKLCVSLNLVQNTRFSRTDLVSL